LLIILALLPCRHGQQVGRVTHGIGHASAISGAKLTPIGESRNPEKGLDASFRWHGDLDFRYLLMWSCTKAATIGGKDCVSGLGATLFPTTTPGVPPSPMCTTRLGTRWPAF
jgi:hypothetical protein